MLGYTAYKGTNKGTARSSEVVNCRYFKCKTQMHTKKTILTQDFPGWIKSKWQPSTILISVLKLFKFNGGNQTTEM